MAGLGDSPEVSRIAIVFVITTAVVILGGFWLVCGPSFGLISAAVATQIASWPLMKSLRT